MFNNAKKGELTQAHSSKRHTITINIEDEYRVKWKKIQKHFDNKFETAPSKADVWRNAINHIYKELYEQVDNS